METGSSSADSGGAAVLFDGAAAAAKPVDDNQLYMCSLCDKSFPFYSQMAYLNAQDKAFHKSYDGDVSKAIDSTQDKEWHQIGSPSKIAFACYICAGEAHNETYLNNRGSLSAKWRNAADLSKGRHHKAKIGRVLHTIEKQYERSTGEKTSAKNVMEAMRDERTAKATDWVTNLGYGSFLLYGCPPGKGCGTYPLKSDKWWRMSGAVNASGTVTNGYWSCANCLLRWSWKECGNYRVFIVMAPDESENNLVAYIGGHYAQNIEQEIMILKGAQLLDTINGQTITAETLLRAIDRLNEVSEKMLVAKLKGIKWVIAQDPSKKFDTPLFCEDPRLSIERPGVQYQALILKEEKDIPILTIEELQRIIDVTSAFMDLTKFEAKGKAMQKTLKRMRARSESPATQQIVDDVLKQSALQRKQ